MLRRWPPFVPAFFDSPFVSPPPESYTRERKYKKEEKKKRGEDGKKKGRQGGKEKKKKEGKGEKEKKMEYPFTLSPTRERLGLTWQLTVTVFLIGYKI